MPCKYIFGTNALLKVHCAAKVIYCLTMYCNISCTCLLTFYLTLVFPGSNNFYWRLGIIYGKSK